MTTSGNPIEDIMTSSPAITLTLPANIPGCGKKMDIPSVQMLRITCKAAEKANMIR
jgi:hypothetical protein